MTLAIKALSERLDPSASTAPTTSLFPSTGILPSTVIWIQEQEDQMWSSNKSLEEKTRMYDAASSTSQYSSPYIDRPLRFKTHRTGRRVYVVIFAMLLVTIFGLRLFATKPVSSLSLEIYRGANSLQPRRPAYLTEMISYNTSVLPNAAFQPPEFLPHRALDTVDTFATYKYRSTCDISSLDLHAPFAPLCHDRKALLTAMSSGGRVGNDAPYLPRGCDMRWFSTEEVCEILSRFEKVIIVGDSMMRHVIGSINVLIRKDLGYGAVTDWNFSPEER